MTEPGRRALIRYLAIGLTWFVCAGVAHAQSADALVVSMERGWSTMFEGSAE
jgi:hypothetical protein